MILVELQIENYKQFAGSQTIEFPSEGAVAVIGANGVGKTTLFEAIEWCLYNPRQIPNDEIPPRGGVGDTKVTLTLEDPRDGARYVIERIRRRRGVDAEIYRADRPESPIVKGTRDVTEYVRQRLIGLSHRAFVSTFFTRQKELSFFGDLKETDRRREVAQLLGFETIRAAQQIISDDRTAARDEVNVLVRQLEEAQDGRDIEAEIETAHAAVETATATESTALQGLAERETSQRTARECLERLRETERQDAALAREIERLQGDYRAADAGRKHAGANLARLDQLEADRVPLLPMRDQEPELAQALVVHEANAERFRRLRSLRESVDRSLVSIDDSLKRTRAIVRQTDTRALNLPGWHWEAGDDQGPAAGLDRLASVIDQVDAPASTRLAQDLAELLRAGAKRDEDRDRVVKYQERLNQRRREITELLAEGNPRERIDTLNLQRDDARQTDQAAAATVNQCGTRRTEIERTIRAIESAAKEPECPTCHRPLTAADAEIAISPLREQIARLVEEAEKAEAGRRQAQREIAQIEAMLKTEQERMRQLDTLEQKAHAGIEYLNEAQEAASSSAEDCLSRLQLLGRDTIPSRAEVDAAERMAESAIALANLRTSIASLHEQLTRSQSELDATQAEISAIGTVDYDQGAHERARTALEEARSAVARLAQIDRELANRPQYDRELAAAHAAMQSVRSQLDSVESDRRVLAFDRSQLDAAVIAERDATTRVREADAAVAAARTTLQSACRDRDGLLAARQRLQDLARKSEIRRREHDELDRMYKEFSKFDQYVAQLVTPQLADYTGELLAEVTDRAYDQVMFDDNYGVRIFDGPDHFPIDQFSGGERDVAALCARLALSRFIGAQAAHPPRFLVLDEVFGSLDADRRSHVLNALLMLAGTDGPFRQLFIISHVDDVRNSPALDEVWRVREVDGASKVENVSRTLSVEDL